jgi:hypothetical protein
MSDPNDLTPDEQEMAATAAAVASGALEAIPLWPERSAMIIEPTTGKIRSLQMTFVTDEGDRVYLELKDDEITMKWANE